MSGPGCILSPIIQEAICSGQQLQNEEAFFFFFEGVCMCDVYKMPSQWSKKFRMQSDPVEELGL